MCAQVSRLYHDKAEEYPGNQVNDAADCEKEVVAYTCQGGAEEWGDGANQSHASIRQADIGRALFGGAKFQSD